MNLFVCNDINGRAFYLGKNSSKIDLVNMFLRVSSIYSEELLKNPNDIILVNNEIEKIKIKIKIIEDLTDLISNHQPKYKTYKAINFLGQKVALNSRFDEDSKISFLFSFYEMTLLVQENQGCIFIFKIPFLSNTQRQVARVIKNNQKGIAINTIEQILMTNDNLAPYDSISKDIIYLSNFGFIKRCDLSMIYPTKKLLQYIN